MAQPITWRTVQGPSQVDPSRAMALAENSFSRAFDRVGNVISDAEKTQAANWEATKTQNTQSFLDSLSQFRTPEALEAARADGSLDRMRAGFGAQVDSNVTRNALEGRLDTLYKQTKTADEYKNYQIDRDQAPIRDQVLSLAAQGNAAGAMQLLEANPGLRNAAEMHKAVVSGERDLTKFTREGEKFADDRKKAAMDLRTGESRLLTDAAQRGQIGVATSNAALQGQELRRTIGDRAQLEKITEKLAEDAMFHKQSGSKDDTAAMEASLKNLAESGAPARLIMQAREKAAQLFDGVAQNAPIGREAASAAAKKAEDAAKEAWYKENGIAAPGSTEPMRNIDSLTKFASTAVTDKDEQATVNRTIAKLSRTQIDLGNGTKIGVPEQILKQAILESKNPWGWNDRGDQVEDIVKKLMKDDRIIEDIAARNQIDAASIRRKFTDALTGGASVGSKKK